MTRKALWQIILLTVLMIGIALFIGCSLDPDPEDLGEEETATIPPPENLIGTIALENGKSAVMNVQFDTASANYLPGTASRSTSTVSVTGTVRYEGEDYIVGGLYNDETGALDLFAENSSGQRFVFSGTYTPGEGFSGTVILYDSDLTTIITEGSVSATEATDEDAAEVKIYVGTFGGDAWGTWNGTLTADKFYGTWSGQTPGGYDSGTFFMNRSGNTLSTMTGTNGPTGGGGTISGTIISGWWDGIEGTSGSWTGAEVDAAYDPHEPTSGDDGAYLANIIMQAFENGLALYGNAVDQGAIAYGDSYSNITAVSPLPDYDTDGRDEYVYTFGIDPPYEDTQTGLKLAGRILIEYQNPEETVWHLIIDSDVTNTAQDSGLTITYQDATTSTLFVDAEIDEGGETITANNFVTAVWELDSTDVLSDVLAVFF